MGQVITNLKARFGADTSDLKKGLKDGEKAVDDFKGAAGDSVSKLADLFGVNMGAINEALQTTQRSLNFLGTSFNAASKGAKVMTIAMNVLKVALISTGIGALIVALGSLVSYFKGTGEGADKFRVIMAKLRSVIDNLVDRLQSFGAGLVDIFSGRFRDGVEKIRGAFKGVGEEIKEDWVLAGQLAASENELYRMETQLITSLGERRQKVEELRLAARDLTLTQAEQLAAQQEAMEITKTMLADEIGLEQKRLGIMQEKLRISATDPTREQLREIAEQEAKIDQLRASGSTRMRELIEYYNTLSRSINAAAEAQKKLAEEAGKAWQKMLDQPPMIVPLVDIEGLKGQLADVQKAVVPVVDEIGKTISATIEGALEDMLSGFGEWLGNMMIGQAGFEDLSQMILGTIGSLAVQLGEIAIAMGTTLAAIDASFSTMNPALVIAAGVALVALGTAVKGAVNAMASSGASSMNSISQQSGSYVYDTRVAAPLTQPIAITVGGELRLRGQDLYAAIKEEQRRLYSNT